MKKLELKTTGWGSFMIFLLLSTFAITAFGSATDTTKNTAVNHSPAIVAASNPPQKTPGAITPSPQSSATGTNCKVSEIVNFTVDSIAPADGVNEKKVSPLNQNGKQTSPLTQNNAIMITITNPKDFMLSRPSDNSDLILYANNFPLKGMKTDYFKEISRQYLNDPTKCWPDTMQIPFAFTRDTSNEAAWNSMFKLTQWHKNKINLKMSLGWSGMFPLNISTNAKVNNSVTVIFYQPWVFWIFSLIYFIFIICLIILCSRSGLIRDPDVVNGAPGAYSLAQTQLAFWTVVVIGGFCYLWILTGQADSLNSSILLLLGISSGTTGAAGFIDYYKKTSLEKSLTTRAAQGPIPTTAAAAPLADPAVPAVVNAPMPVPNTLKQHRSFLEDILSDGFNMSVQRTQTAIWNLVLGLYFIWYVVTNKAMPDFDNTLLVLAGVSSVLYVGSKGTENPQTKPNSVTS